MLRLLAIVTTFTIFCAATAIDSRISVLSESESQSEFGSRLTQIHMPNSAFETTLPGVVRSIAMATLFSLMTYKYQQALFLKIKTNRILESKLLSRLDRNVAYRLVNSAKKSNPGKSEQWYLEKVIYDLNRDRR